MEQGLAWDPPSHPQSGPGPLDPAKGHPTEDVASHGDAGLVVPGNGPRPVALSPIGVQALGCDHFLEMLHRMWGQG